MYIKNKGIIIISKMIDVRFNDTFCLYKKLDSEFIQVNYLAKLIFCYIKTSLI